MVHLTAGCAANTACIGKEPAAVTGLVALLTSDEPRAQWAAATALSNLTVDFPANSNCIGKEPGAISGLASMLSSRDADAQFAAAMALAALAAGSTANSRDIAHDPCAMLVWLSCSAAVWQLHSGQAHLPWC